MRRPASRCAACLSERSGSPSAALVFLAWPHLLSAAAALLWALVLYRRLESPLAFALTAYMACLVSVEAIDYACGFLVPLDVAGTPPPDPRNAWLRFLITAAVQIPSALVVAAVLALPFKVTRQRNRT
jgi:hypothetical protein